jgi:hypothetical protein
MEERKYKVMWRNNVIARDMRIEDALIFIKALCDEYFCEKINITLLNNDSPETTYN